MFQPPAYLVSTSANTPLMRVVETESIPRFRHQRRFLPSVGSLGSSSMTKASTSSRINTRPASAVEDPAPDVFAKEGEGIVICMYAYHMHVCIHTFFQL